MQPGKLRWIIYHGPKRRLQLAKMGSTHVVLTTYNTLRVEKATQGALFEQEWARVILDEGTTGSTSPGKASSFNAFR